MMPHCTLTIKTAPTEDDDPVVAAAPGPLTLRPSGRVGRPARWRV